MLRCSNRLTLHRVDCLRSVFVITFIRSSHHMKVLWLPVALALILASANADAHAAEDTPAEQFAALLKQYNPASGALRKAKTDVERKAAVERLGTFSSRFIKLAEDNPRDPIALKAMRQAIQAVGSTDSAALITWETNQSHFAAGSSDESVRKIVTLLLQDHLKSDGLSPICDRMRYGYRIEFGTFLTAVLRDNPHREVQAVACLCLAQYLNDRLRMLQLTKDRPELSKCYETVFGKDYLTQLKRLERAKAAKRIETLFERAADDYGDVKIRGDDTVGARARTELYEIRRLGIGKLAPDIVGKDADDRTFRLSDYRGKVVLLYFWSEY